MKKEMAVRRSPCKVDIVDPVLGVEPLRYPWKTIDPFLVCGHHHDAYPPGNATLEPEPSIGRAPAHDAEGRGGWRMYHGGTVPGFPVDPHSGFETITIVRCGFVDHSDSMGATARYGEGDVQWLTAGRGIAHSEMFPLLRRDRGNPLEFFQIWLNLPAERKLVAPRFSMLWKQDIPRHAHVDANGRLTQIDIIAGKLAGAKAPAPPPDSWAARPENDVAIWVVRMEADATFKLPPTQPGTNRTLYLHAGGSLLIGGWHLPRHHRITLHPDMSATLRATGSAVSFLLLQGRPIAEPIVQQVRSS
ncbi:MAG: pirin family protein [Luteimonas sp.]|nr:pirin family protein [Luteimonas sp.]